MMNAIFIHFFDSMGDPILRHVDMEWVGMVVTNRWFSLQCHKKHQNFLEQHWGFHHGEMSIRVSHPESYMGMSENGVYPQL